MVYLELLSSGRRHQPFKLTRETYIAGSNPAGSMFTPTFSNLLTRSRFESYRGHTTDFFEFYMICKVCEDFACEEDYDPYYYVDKKGEKLGPLCQDCWETKVTKEEEEIEEEID